jgi:putative MATE family efflux protein
MQVNSSYKEILTIALPVMVGSVAMTILNITDTAFLGRMGETELGASAVGGILYFAFAMIGVSIGTGAQIMIARRSGENNEKTIGGIFDNSIVILFSLSLVLFVLLKWASPFLLRLILQSEELIQATESFLEYRSYGLIFIMIATAFRSFYVGIAKTSVIGIYSFLMAGINFLLCYALIFGNFGFERMGITGAGLASSVSELFAMLFLFIYTYFKKAIRQYDLLKFKEVSMHMINKIMNLSNPLIVQNLLSMGSWFIFFIFIEKIGKHELAISNIVRGAYMINMTPVWGFSVAANSMVSNIIGQGKHEEVMALINRIIRITLLITLAVIGINLLIPVQIMSLFTNDELLISDSLGSLQVVDMAMLFFSFAIVTISAVSGTGATRVALKIEIAAIVIYMVYNYLAAFVFNSSVEILWMSEIVYWLFTGIVSYKYLLSKKWSKIAI